MVFHFVTFLYIPAYIVIYGILLFLFPYFFHQSLPRFNKRFFYSIVTILVVYLFFFVFSEVISISHEELGNRILHAFAGGFTAFLMCFLAARDSKVTISTFQFFVLSFLMVTTLGVASEIAEFFGQNYTSLIFAPTINDTWLDLVSNWVGALFGAICCTPFIRKVR